MASYKHVLPVIVLSQFCCTSLWFAGNAVMDDLITNFNLSHSALGHLTSAVQFGFIAGTMVFAIFTIADRYSPSKVFLISALLGALCNLGIIWEQNSIASLLCLRFLTGFFLAGIYPIGMKIATDYYDKGLGKSLGLLVGALVLGTAFPHLLKGNTELFPWKLVVITTSSLAVAGGLLMMFLVPDGPYRKPSKDLKLTACFSVFRNKTFRSAAIGYFGHMWELYVFWAFVPIMLTTYAELHISTTFSTSTLSFFIIGIGGLACMLSGYISQRLGTQFTASTALLLSGMCCLLSPWAFAIPTSIAFITFLLFWGIVVVADSPLLSTLVAQNAPPETRGTALTIVNSIGFLISIISIQLINGLIEQIDSTQVYLLLSIGPLIGLITLVKKKSV